MADSASSQNPPDRAPSGPPPPPAGPPVRVGALTAVLGLAMGIGPLVIYGLSALAPLVIEDLGLSKAAFGALATVAFLVAAAASAGLGSAADRLRGRAAVAAIFAVGVGALVAAASAESYAWLVCAVVLSGLAQSLSNPVTNRLVAAHAPASLRGTLVGLKQSGVQLSQLVAGLLLPSIALLAGWRGALGTGVAVGCVGLLLALWLVPGSGAGPVRRGRTAGTGEAGGAGRGRLPGAVWWLAGYALLSGAALQATNVYLPLFAHQGIGLGPVLAGLAGAAAGGVGMVARVLWARAVGAGGRPHRALLLLAGTSVLSAGLLWGASVTGSAVLLWTGAVGHGASALAANAVLMVAVMGVVRADRLGRASGLLAVGLYLGFAAGPVTLGLVVDAVGSYTPGWLAVGGCYVCALALTLAWWGLSRRSSA